KCGLKPIKLHELRHSNISLLLESGAGMKELQEWAGHSSYHTTANVYAHLQKKSKTKLTNAIDSMLEIC
ncbi:MAG: tyrosine-type recombinase/integrase, partial [Clostridiales bacterium]|nr:tyrosine-type recombinase/integrase [Clostridiales bacterium]